TMYLQKSKSSFPVVFVFGRIPAFRRFSGLFIDSFLVYTSIIEQKRIAGQEKKLIIFILFKNILILRCVP
ncbi:MAG: hypothetical protein J6W79_03295, partial [Alphaproteobacteria bacterium]|nr:hypothetical protein [Alphaproteobacteria bacterium]